MIDYEDQTQLFTLISRNLTEDVECYAFGGTAMMFYGYKDETKDIDLFFEDERSRTQFVKALVILGYEEVGAENIYIPEKLKNRHKPLMYKRQESRFDLFAKQIFAAKVSAQMKENVYAIHEFRKGRTLKIKVLRREFIVMLKCVTERRRDFDDILSIIMMERNFDWQLLVEEALWQYENGDKWILFDLERNMVELQKHVVVEQKYITALHDAAKAKG